MSPNATSNYADLVLQEAAAAEEAYKNLKFSNTKSANELTSSVVQLNLTDEEKFPALGKTGKLNSFSFCPKLSF